MNSLHKRLALIESKRRVVLTPLIIIYQAKSGISEEQQQRINTAVARGRAARLIKTFVADAN